MMDQKADEMPADHRHLLFHEQDQLSGSQQLSSDCTSSTSTWTTSSSGDSEIMIFEDGQNNATYETILALDVTVGDDQLAPSNDDMPDFSSSELSLSEVCISTNNNNSDDMNYEVQQALRIFSGILLDKYKGITSSFLHPIEDFSTRVKGQVQSLLRESMCLLKIKNKFDNKEYVTITEFVADFRLMLESCYRYHGVDHWISKQAQKLEMMLEQKLSLLSRALRDKTTLAMTSEGRFGLEEDRGSGGTSTRRRLPTRSPSSSESTMVQTIRTEELNRAREEKRLRDLERKEAGEVSTKELITWEKNLLAQAFPYKVENLWEIPAIGHFLCLARNVLNLPDVIFFELERCLLMPQCSQFLAHIMTCLLFTQKQGALQHRVVLPYCRWESKLRHEVSEWFRRIGAAKHQARKAEELGLCFQFFRVIGQENPLKENHFHEIPFYQRVWILKGLCDYKFETQKEIQYALLNKPALDCRESILGYDSEANAYIHFPHFCGSDLRIYIQSSNLPLIAPPPDILVKTIETAQEAKSNEPQVARNDTSCDRNHSEKRNSGQSDEREINPRERSTEKNTTNQDDGERFTSSQTRSSAVSEFRFGNKQLILIIDNQRYLARSPAASPMPVSKPPSLELNKETLSKRSEITAIGPAKSTEDFRCYTTPGSSTDMRTQSTQTSRDVIIKEETVETEQETQTVERDMSNNQRHLECPDRIGAASSRAATADKNTTDERSANTIETTTTRLSEDDRRPQSSFKLICSNVSELRIIISKIEDELDLLESRRQQMPQWATKQAEVKQLHSNLIRLLNELLPCEPRLIKAHHKNRLRMKKEYDEYKNHPESRDFQREEFDQASDESDCEDLEIDDLEISEEDDMEHIVPQNLWSRASTSEVGAQSAEERAATFTKEKETVHRNSESANGLKDLSQLPDIINLTTELGSPTSPSTSGHVGENSPIPTLVAKSVGNKVILRKRPSYFPMEAIENGTIKRSLLSYTTSNIQGSSSSLLQIPQQMQIASQQGIAKARPLVKPQCIAFEPQKKKIDEVTRKGPYGLGCTVRKCNHPPIQQLPHSIVVQKAVEKVKENVAQIPKNTHVLRTVANVSSARQPDAQVAVHKMTSPVCLSTNVPGFSIPERNNLAQQVPLKDARMQGRIPPCPEILEEIRSPQQVGLPPPSSTAQLTSRVSTHILRPSQIRQELKTMCIRDSQSILVTTRGGNTGIVKVHNSSDQNPVGAISTSPVLTNPPPLKKFIVSKTAQSLPSSSLASPSNIGAINRFPIAQAQPRCSHRLCWFPNSPSTSGVRIPVTRPGSSNTPTVPTSTGVQMQMSGKTTTTGQNIGTLSKSHPKTLMASASGTCRPKVTATPAMIPKGVTTVTHSNQLGTFNSRPTINLQMEHSSSAILSQTSSTQSQTGPITNTISSGTTQAPFEKRLVIKTPTTLAAGTCILFDNLSYTVPGQGLSPGSHVFICPTPAPTVPPSNNANTSTIGSSPPQLGRPFTVLPALKMLTNPTQHFAEQTKK